MHYVHCLCNVHNQSTALCLQILCVDIEVEYFCDNIIYHYSTSVCIFLWIQCTKSSMELVWKYGRLSSIPFLKSSIPFWHLPYSIPKFAFHSIFIPFHTMPCRNLAPAICFFIDNVFRIGIFPHSCKIARVIPLCKSGKTDNLTNYHRIWILTCFSKIFEKLIHKRLTNFF